MRNLFFIGLMGMLFGLGIAPGHGAKGVVLSTGIWDLQEKPTHTVKSGETLFQISRMYNVAVNDLRKWNQLQSRPRVHLLFYFLLLAHSHGLFQS